MQNAIQQISSNNKLSNNGSYHLSPEEINFVIAELGQFKKYSDIQKGLKSTFSRSITSKGLKEFESRNKDKIKQIRDIWVNSLADEAGSHKRIRVLKLWDMFCDLEQDASSKEDHLKIRFHKQMESLLNSLRIEMEGNTLNINYRNLSTQRDDELIDTARDVLNKVDPSLIEDADFDILGGNDDK